MPVPSNYRWLFHDLEGNEPDYRVPFNPNRMTSPYKPKRYDTLRGPNGRIRTLRLNSAPHEWTFSGVIRTDDHYQNLRVWADMPNAIEITDHLGRVWKVLPQRFNANEKRPSARIPDKYDYDFTVLVLAGPS